MNKLSLIPAATVLMIRDIDDGMEVLMAKRSKKPPFENLFVFLCRFRFSFFRIWADKRSEKNHQFFELNRRLF